MDVYIESKVFEDELISRQTAFANVRDMLFRFNEGLKSLSLSLSPYCIRLSILLLLLVHRSYMFFNILVMILLYIF